MKILHKLPSNPRHRKWVAVGITVPVATALTAWGIYAIEEYGIALFIFTPLLIGILSSALYGYGRKISKSEAAETSFLSLGVFMLGLLLFAMEGLICIVMAAPIGLLMTWVGSLLGRLTVHKAPDKSLTILLLAFLSVPLTAFTERHSEVPLYTVSTRTVIDADIETVWKNVIEFPRMDEPTEFIFKAGISYPIDSEIKGTGVGAIRYCNFNTGSFVEPITEWSAPHVLRFDVREQPEPMTEYSLWDIRAPHLHDYFVSERGEFRLSVLPDGQTELVGTTWYRHNIRPGIYWRIWSDRIIHSIHERVLNHIKKNAEKED